MADTATYVVQGLRSPFARIDRELEAFDALRALRAGRAADRRREILGLGRGGDRQVDLVVWGSVIPSLAVANWGREVWLDAALDQSRAGAHDRAAVCHQPGRRDARGRASPGGQDRSSRSAEAWNP